MNMAHFVAIPPPRNNHIPNPNFKKLALHDPSGNAAIAVWGCAKGWTIVAADNPRFASDLYRVSGLLSFFMLRGLKAGDKIGVTDGTNWQTELLEISFAGSDKNPKNNVASRRSAHKSTLILDPAGIEQGVVKTNAEDWMGMTDAVIEAILNNPVGRIVLDALTTDITIHPFLGAQLNATSAVQFTPQMWMNEFRPGGRPSEVLFHEFCHILDDNFSGYKDVTNPPGGSGPLTAEDTMVYAPADFFSVTASNVFASAFSRPLRKDWAGVFAATPATYSAGAVGAARFRTFQDANFNNFRSRKGAVFTSLSGATAAWNPFR
jgi:hypothetical protein